ncbi:MAG TPA: hypothetical protein VN618_03920 [Solirubrobacteraceae bacterium]|nr:hypothetical protein [Solirubrobacteraceae bacterium]
MSPATLRRYRAERLLARDFESLRESVLATVAARLRAAGTTLDRAELEACYAAAWQGLYGAALAGEEISNPRAWLILVTYRRAIEELRAPGRAVEPLPLGAHAERDLDGELDDRARMRALLHGMRARLDLREREAAALCYLHGYSRREAAERMGVSELRMRKLMEGTGRREGVSAKIAEVVETIRADAVCARHESLMRALAFGVLDPEGERYRLAVMHRRDCPACRRYVVVLRGAAAVLPPVLTLPAGPTGALLRLAGLGHHAAAGPVAASLPSLGASAATGGGAGASGGWALGGLGAKLAAGCLLLAGVGAGCVAIVHDGPPSRAHRSSAGPLVAPAGPRAVAATAPPLLAPTSGGAGRARRVTGPASRQGPGRPSSGSPIAAAREFGLEQPARVVPGSSTNRAIASAAGSAPPSSSAPAGEGSTSSSSSSSSSLREFSPG